MRILSLASLAVAPLLAASLSAGAADLPRREPEYKAPAMVAAPATPWTGCYVGGNIGAAWGSGKISSLTSTASVSGTSNAGFAGGGQIGCDYQAGGWVFGVRNLTDWSNLGRNATISTGGTISAKNNWVDLLTGRIGYAVAPVWLVYFQGGGAWKDGTVQQFNGAGAQIGQVSGGRTGWTVGLGSEYKFAPNWSAFAEWNYADFGTNGVTIPAGFSGNVSTKASLVLFGVNYRF
jgi:outer membrane immunogenic protein